jgi:chemosensory pili system protein ChpA (sensor histidine kinase/response regulator)
MVPFTRLAPRLNRIVRTISQELGKQVQLLVSASAGELDRSVLERMIPPLEHMLRNAVDHGIESPARRRELGKPETGRVQIRLQREASEIVIEIADDGAGIDPESVRRKAIERGLMAQDARLSDRDVLGFIFNAGFSTAHEITQISGRGVGMDVAASEVKQLGGSIDLQSVPGRGTRFTIRLPFTVSVNRALMVMVGDDMYAVPLNSIEGIVRATPNELVAQYATDTPSFSYAGMDYQLGYLGSLLARERMVRTDVTSLPVLLTRSGDEAVAVHVDAVHGSREIVVKSLGPQFAGVSGVSGATLLGDGSVVVILDLPGLIRRRAHDRDAAAEVLPLKHDRSGLCVMVVDDSVTVRKVTSRLLERQGFEVLLAKDGVEAVAQLQERRPDVMLLDIEMPRMDGFEVAQHVRHDERYSALPIIMISSRTGQKHRDRATQIGVDRFLGKPFQESDLLASIQELTDGRSDA